MPKTGQKKTPVVSRIPDFASIEEEAEFWDTHSTTEFEDEWEDVTGQIQFIRGGPTKFVRVRLDLESFATLEKLAKEHGVRASRLGRVWLFDRAWEEEHPSSQRKRKPEPGKSAKSKAG